ncbi:MAG: carbohydrate kinase family protein [Pseudomonadota bacterium]
MSALAVTGYASLDYAIGLAGQIGGDETTLINHRDPRAWPRIGGCPAYMAMAVAAKTEAVSPVTWIGSGPESDLYVETLASTGVATNGIARLRCDRAPTAIMAYQGDGTCACLFDPVFAGDEELTTNQSDIIASASHLCVSVGPPHLIGQILALRESSARLYWVVKNDARCFTPDVAAEISAIADVIFCNASERSLVGSAANAAVIVETRGPDGISVTHGGSVREMPVETMPVRDATGAGDTLAGGYVAAEMSGVGDPVSAAQAGLDAARRMLQERLERKEP